MADLEALAWEAVVTPSLGAEPALHVLADALLERGEIREPWKPAVRSGRTTKSSDRSRRRSRAYVLGAAMFWARRAVLPRVPVSARDGFQEGDIVRIRGAFGHSDGIAVLRHGQHRYPNIRGTMKIEREAFIMSFHQKPAQALSEVVLSVEPGEELRVELTPEEAAELFPQIGPARKRMRVTFELKPQR